YKFFHNLNLAFNTFLDISRNFNEIYELFGFYWVFSRFPNVIPQYFLLSLASLHVISFHITLHLIP
ncbi:hypothetical protein L9F63_016990, partial [Diploptera punctata]